MARSSTVKRPLNNRPTTATVRVTVLAAFLMALPACSAQPRNFTNDNDRLRRENVELRDSVRQLQVKLEQRLTQIESLEQRLERPSTQPIEGVTAADIPRAAMLRFSRYTAALDTNSDRVDDLLRVYVRTLDQEGRFIPVAGQAVVQAVAIRPNTPPLVVVEKTFAGKALQDAYRSNMTGTHYTLDVPLADPPSDVGTLTVKVTLTDAATGAVLTHEMAVAVRGK